MTDEVDLQEAVAAIEAARVRHSKLTDFGFGVFNETSLSPAEYQTKFAEERAAFRPAQVATAIAFLRTCEVVKKPNHGSYGLKHRAEQWGKRNGRESYVTNGALIVAAVHLGLPLQVLHGPNANVGVSKKSIDAHLASEK